MVAFSISAPRDRELIADPKVRRVEFVDAIPKSASGKIMRRDLRAREAAALYLSIVRRSRQRERRAGCSGGNRCGCSAAMVSSAERKAVTRASSRVDRGTVTQ